MYLAFRRTDHPAIALSRLIAKMSPLVRRIPGMAFSALTVYPWTYPVKVPWANVVTLCILDGISAGFNFTGLVLAGSATFTVVYSSCVVFTAIFSRIFLKRKLKHIQWAGVLVIMFGLSITSLAPGIRSALWSTSTASTATSPADLDENATVLVSETKDTVQGTAFIFIGSIFHSLCYIMSENILLESELKPELLSTLMGIFGVFIFGLWQVFYTIPHFDTLVRSEVASHHGSLWVIITAYSTLILSNLVHAVCFFHLLSLLGSTSVGVLKGVQSVLVFVLSHFAFCSMQPNQCFTSTKALSLCLVVLGVLAYSNVCSNGYPRAAGETDDKFAEMVLHGVPSPPSGHARAKGVHNIEVVPGGLPLTTTPQHLYYQLNADAAEER